MNFLSVKIGGISVAYALVQILLPDLLSPPNGNPAVGMLAALLFQRLRGTLVPGFWAFATPVHPRSSVRWLVFRFALSRDGTRKPVENR